jgi:ATP-dependent DNA helicase RecG
MLLHPTQDSLADSNVGSGDISCIAEREREQPTLTEPQVAALLKATESAHLELKRVSGKMVSKALETICAFANSHGGTLILGLGDASQGVGLNRIYGIEENPEAVDELRRKIGSQFDHPDIPIRYRRVPVLGRDGVRLHLLLLDVERSEHVHSIVGDGTRKRLGASNCQMTAREIIDLVYKRGDRTAEYECMEVEWARLNTPAWHTYVKARGLTDGDIADQLRRVDLAAWHEGELQPRRAAVVLFAEEPGGHLAGVLARCEIKLLVYSGTRDEASQIPNFRKSPRVFRGPMVDLIESSVRAVGQELEVGITMVGSGCRPRHRLPMRVVKEAIVNAVVHRDYRLNRNIFVRIFDNRIEVESPGGLPGTLTTENIGRRGSKPRNPLIARALFNFPDRPNVDAGEGVRMMFSEMHDAGLYPPQHWESSLAAGDCLTVVLMTEPRHELWDEVSNWIDEKGFIGNSVVCTLGKLNTERASRLLKKWADLGFLRTVEGRGRKNRIYVKAGAAVGYLRDPLQITPGGTNTLFESKG